MNSDEIESFEYQERTLAKRLTADRRLTREYVLNALASVGYPDLELAADLIRSWQKRHDRDQATLNRLLRDGKKRSA